MNKVIIQKLNKIVATDTSFNIKKESDKWVVEMPSIKIKKSDVEYISRFGFESYVDLQYSLFEEKVWKHFVSKLSKSLPSSLKKIDKWELQDDYVYPNVIIQYPSAEVFLS